METYGMSCFPLLVGSIVFYKTHPDHDVRDPKYLLGDTWMETQSTDPELVDRWSET